MSGPERTAKMLGQRDIPLVVKFQKIDICVIV